jgi:hypothetical protein
MLPSKHKNNSDSQPLPSAASSQHPTSHDLTLSTSQRFYLATSLLYHKDERALPQNIQSNKIFWLLVRHNKCAASHCTCPPPHPRLFFFFSLSSSRLSPWTLIPEARFPFQASRSWICSPVTLALSCGKFSVMLQSWASFGTTDTGGPSKYRTHLPDCTVSYFRYFQNCCCYNLKPVVEQN